MCDLMERRDELRKHWDELGEGRDIFRELKVELGECRDEVGV